MERRSAWWRHLCLRRRSRHHHRSLERAWQHRQGTSNAHQPHLLPPSHAHLSPVWHTRAAAHRHCAPLPRLMHTKCCIAARAWQSGGGIFAEGGAAVTITDHSSVLSNTASSPFFSFLAAGGGGIYVGGGVRQTGITVTITGHSNVLGNTARVRHTRISRICSPLPMLTSRPCGILALPHIATARLSLASCTSSAALRRVRGRVAVASMWRAELSPSPITRACLATPPRYVARSSAVPAPLFPCSPLTRVAYSHCRTWPLRASPSPRAPMSAKYAPPQHCQLVS